MMTSDSNSPFTTVIGLGGLKAEYKRTGRGRWAGLIFGLLCLLAAPALLLVALYVAYTTYNDSGLYKVAENAAFPAVAAVAAFVIGAAVVFNQWRNWRLAAALFENGVAYQNRTGIQQVSWTDVAAVWQRVTRHYTNGV